LSATDFGLRALHARDDAVAEEQEEDQRAPDERGRERDTPPSRTRIARTAGPDLAAKATLRRNAGSENQNRGRHD
jgi:hypothetical protein